MAMAMGGEGGGSCDGGNKGWRNSGPQLLVIGGSRHGVESSPLVTEALGKSVSTVTPQWAMFADFKVFLKETFLGLIAGKDTQHKIYLFKCTVQWH